MVRPLMKKFIASLSLVAIFAVPLFALPQNAVAQTSNSFANVGIGCLSNLGSSYLIDALNSLTKVPVGDSQQLNEVVLNACIKPLKRAVTQELLKKVTQETTKWVNTGFEGNPFYLRDTQSYYKSLANEQVRDFVSELKVSANPFDRDIAKNLVSQYTASYASKSKFNLDTVIGPNWKDFNNDFSAGGWEGWIAMTQSSQNNPVGSFLNASNELAKRNQATEETNKQELQANNGFLSMKKCVEKKTTGLTSSSVSTDEEATYSALGYDPASESNDCARYETVTPGSIIQAQLDRAVGTGQKQLEAGNDLNDGITSVFTSLFTELYNGGVSSIGDSGVASGSGSNIAVFGGYGNNSIQNNLSPVNGGGGTGIGNGSTHWFDTNPTFNIETAADLQKVIDDQAAYIITLNQEIAAIANRVIPAIYQADFCVPGPHPGWEQTAQSEVSRKQTEIMTLDEEGMSDIDKELRHATYITQWLGAPTTPDINVRGKDKVSKVINRVFQGEYSDSNVSFFEGYMQKIRRRYQISPTSLPPSAGAIFTYYAKLPTYQSLISPNVQTGEQGTLVKNAGIADANRRRLVSLQNTIATAKAQLANGSITQTAYNDIITTANNTFKSMSSTLATKDMIDQTAVEIDRVNQDTEDLMNPTQGLIHQCEVEVNQNYSQGIGRYERLPYPSQLVRPNGATNYPTISTYLPGYVYGGTAPLPPNPIPGEGYDIHLSDTISLTGPGSIAAFERLIKIY